MLILIVSIGWILIALTLIIFYTFDLGSYWLFSFCWLDSSRIDSRYFGFRSNWLSFIFLWLWSFIWLSFTLIRRKLEFGKLFDFQFLKGLYYPLNRLEKDLNILGKYLSVHYFMIRQVYLWVTQIVWSFKLKN